MKKKTTNVRISICFRSPGSDPEKLVYAHAGGGSGGYLEHAAKFAASVLLETQVDSLSYKVLR